MQFIIKMVLLALILSLLLISTKTIAEAPIEGTRPDIKVYAFEKILDRWGSDHWDAFDKIIGKESNWTVTGPHYPESKKSSAYGLGGFLDGTWAGVGCVKTKDQYKQIECTIQYIENRYNTPKKALQFHLKNNYY